MNILNYVYYAKCIIWFIGKLKSHNNSASIIKYEITILNKVYFKFENKLSFIIIK